MQKFDQARSGLDLSYLCVCVREIERDGGMREKELQKETERQKEAEEDRKESK